MAKLRLACVNGMLPMTMSGVKVKGCEEQWHMKRAKEKKEAHSTQVTSPIPWVPIGLLKPYHECLVNSPTL